MPKQIYSLAVTLIIAFTLLSARDSQASDVCGDADGNSIVTISDAVHLINYIFGGGATPVCGTGPSEIGTVTDIDSNLYYTAKIGDQWWMIENLKVTHYRNGDPIPNVTASSEWTSLSTGAYCDYGNSPSNTATYGRLYNRHAIADNRNLAPAGWHVPTDVEWKQLEIYLGMSQAEADADSWRGTDEGGKLKESGTTHWLSPNTGATNESGFSALPSGYRNSYGTDLQMSYYSYFWSSTEISSGAWSRRMYGGSSQITRSIYGNQYGLSVRCVRD